MCGIFGILAHKKIQMKEKDIANFDTKLRQLAIANTTRGQDSFGYFVIYKDGTILIKKYTNPVWISLFDDDMMSNFTFDPAKHPDNKIPIAIIGHTRAISSNDFKNSVEGAHPHETSKIVGVHNGHITNWKSLNDKAESDSIALFEYLEKTDINVIEKPQGAAACVYVYKDNPFIVNIFAKNRPFSYQNFHENSMIFSSDNVHLLSIINKKTYYYIHVDSLLKVNLSKGCKKEFSRIIPIADKIHKNHKTECYICGYTYNKVPIFVKNNIYTWICSSHKLKCTACKKGDVPMWMSSFRNGGFRCAECHAKYLNRLRNNFPDLKCDFCGEKKEKKIKYTNFNSLIYKLCSECVKNSNKSFDFNDIYDFTKIDAKAILNEELVDA